MSGNSRQRGVFVVVLAALAIGAVGIFGWGMFMRHRSLAFTVVFDNAKGLRPGQFVIYNGVRIGEVVSVDLGTDNKVHVAVTIDPNHEQTVYREAIFKIESPRIINVNGEMQLTMSDGNGGHSPIQRGDVLVGTNGFLDELMKRGRNAFDSMVPQTTTTSR